MGLLADVEAVAEKGEVQLRLLSPPGQPAVVLKIDGRVGHRVGVTPG